MFISNWVPLTVYDMLHSTTHNSKIFFVLFNCHITKIGEENSQTKVFKKMKIQRNQYVEITFANEITYYNILNMDYNQSC